MKMTPWTWWTVFIVLLALGEGLGWLLIAQDHSAAGQAARWAGAALYAAWIIFGLIRWQDHPWVRRLSALIVVTLLAQFIGLVFYSMGSTGGVYAVGGVWAMGVLFFLGVHAMRLLLSPGHAVTGVARTLLDEAIRMKVPLIFIILLLLFVPALPFVIDPAEQLRYRIQSFMTWSLTATGALLSLMTVFLAVGTITSEIGNRQIFLTMTKPVGRGQYLLGKWLGIMMLNLLLVAVAGGAVYLFTMLLARQQANSYEDWVAVNEQVLVARNAVDPQPVEATRLGAAFRDRLERLRQTEPQVYGMPGEPIDALPTDLRNRIQQQIITEWYSLPPRGMQAYRFTGLARARDLGPTVQLRLKPRASGQAMEGFVHLGVRVNGYFLSEDPIWRLAEDQFHVMDLPSQIITEQGVLDIELHNVAIGNQDQPSIAFSPGDGLQLLYKVGGFEANFIRSLLMMWIRLGFLAMLGLAAGTYLGFPVACLLTLLVYFTAVGSGYLAESFDGYAAFPQADLPLWERIVFVPSTFIAKLTAGEIWDAIKIIIRLIGSGFTLLVPSFADYNPTPLVSDGRYVSPRLLGSAVIWVGLVWTGILALFAWIIFRYRELARVTV